MEIFTPSPTCMLYCANHIWDWGALQPPTHLATLHPLAHPVHHVSGCHHLPTSINIPPTWNSMCMRMCLILDTPPSTHHQTTTWPSLWHPQHWSLGVLCAPLEWPCWALPSSPLGCMPHVSKCGIFIDFHVISPAEQAHTSSVALIISLDDFHRPAIDFQVAITFFI